LRCVAGGSGIVADLACPNARARSQISRVTGSLVRPPARYWLRAGLRVAVLRRAVAVGHSPVVARPVSRRRHCDLHVHFGVMRSRPPRGIESIDPRGALRARPAITTGSTFRDSVTPARMPNVIGSASLVDPPLLRFSSPATLAGGARAIRGGQPPDDPASAFHPALARARAHATCRLG
jgi:hypothetical protein